ncbi:uncharacterized protein LOC131659091 [Vicia villosa]|uniref:uncharacterized protein LOC131659091 n=1 Tax=Vicia villosa TaxID=3911 RepID=UPI00273A9750|nr:uncharacterized protein LOC131659091 [Vicia villosa]
MAGRNDVAIAPALEAVQNQPNTSVNDESHSLSMFQRENLPTFKVHKVQYGTHMLAGEADDWWLDTCQRLEVVGEVITRAVFSRGFLRKYLPEDVRGKKEMEFHELKQGISTVVKYAAKFVELMKFYLHYSVETAGFSKCIKFENGLRLGIKQAIGYQQIRRFLELVNSCRIYEEDNMAHSVYYKSHNEKKGRNKDRAKPYSAPANKGKQKAFDGKKPSGGGAPASVRCYKYGHPNHRASECKNDGPTCFNYGEHGHIST